GRQDSNLRSPVPQTGAFAGLSYALSRGATPLGSKWSSFTSWTRTREHVPTRSSPRASPVGGQAESGSDAQKPSQYGCQMPGSSPSSRRIGGTTGSEAGFFG